MYVIFHYPGQLFISRNLQVLKLYPFDKKMHIYNHFILQIESFEVLKRRHTRNKNCLDDTNQYDEIILSEHLKKIGCRYLFHKHHLEFPLCRWSNESDIEEPESLWNKSRSNGDKAVLNIEKLNVPIACERISQMNVLFENKGVENEKSKLILQLFYPNEVKIITQSKEVDIHSLIGNIGAYLGLFMGNYIKYNNYHFI